MKESKVILVLCSVPGKEEGRRIADRLLEQGLAACISIVPGAESHYVWEGRREIAEECLLFIKTAEEKWTNLSDVIRQLHPYECPEILRLDVTDGWKGYVDWVIASCRSEG